MIFSQFFFAISNFFTGMLQSYRKFIMPALAPILYNVGIVVGTYLFYPQLGIYAAGVGVVLGAFVHMAIQWPQIKALGFRYLRQLNFHFTGVRHIFQMMPARLLTIGITEFQSLSIGFFATQIGSLSFFIIGHAQSIITLPIRFFGVPIAQAALPFLADQAQEKGQHRFRQTIIESLNQISFLAVPAAVLILILRIPLVRLLFGTKNFPWATTVTMGKVVIIIAISIAAQAIYTLLVRAFHALRDTWTPFLISLGVTLLFLLGCFWSTQLSPDAAIYGLALTISLAGFLEAGLHLLFLHFRLHRLITKDLIIPQLKIILSGIIMAIALYIPLKLLDQVVFDTTRVLPLIALTGITGLVGLAVYIGLAVLLRFKEQKIIWDTISKLNRQKLGQVEVKNEPLVAAGDMSDEVI
jgi:putative peptidoglycan lipid II flippase